MNAARMLLLMLGGGVWAAPTSPLEMSGDQIAPEFRDELERNRNFVVQIRDSVETLMGISRLEHPFLFEDQLALLTESQNLVSSHIRSCTVRNFHMETCLINMTTVLEQYHMYLTSYVVEKHFERYHQQIEGMRLDINNLRMNIMNLMRLLDIVPVTPRIEPTRLNFRNDYMEKVFVYNLLKKLKKLMESISRVFNHVLARI